MTSKWLLDLLKFGEKLVVIISFVKLMPAHRHAGEPLAGTQFQNVYFGFINARV
jgi:hypothetical protein